jgi:hypothetical protein
MRPRKANKNVTGIANSGFLAFLCSLLLLVLLQSKNFPAFNPRRPCLDLAHAQTTNKLRSIPPPQPNHKKQRGCGIQMRVRLRAPAKTPNNTEPANREVSAETCPTKPSTVLQECGKKISDHNFALLQRRNGYPTFSKKYLKRKGRLILAAFCSLSSLSD